MTLLNKIVKLISRIPKEFHCCIFYPIATLIVVALFIPVWLFFLGLDCHHYPSPPVDSSSLVGVWKIQYPSDYEFLWPNWEEAQITLHEDGTFDCYNIPQLMLKIDTKSKKNVTSYDNYNSGTWAVVESPVIDNGCYLEFNFTENTLSFEPLLHLVDRGPPYRLAAKAFYDGSDTYIVWKKE